MTINILINGAHGKMGRVSVAAIAKEEDLQLVATTTRGDDLSAAIKKHRADVVVDWTVPDCVFENAKVILDAGARPVVGTTGLSLEEIQLLSDDCKSRKRGAIIAPNFSIGAILMMRYAQDAAKYFPDVEIIEYHHPAKLDAPSGTAKKTAELIAKSKSKKNTAVASYGINHHGVPIHAVRLSGIFAQQQVIFGGAGETFMLQDSATDRNAMMPGLFLCCRKVMALDHLVYGIETLI